LRQFVKNHSKIIEGRQKVWLDINSCLVTITTFQECSLIKQDCPQSVPGFNAIGVELNCTPGRSLRLVQPSAPMEHFGMIAMT